MLGFRYSHWSRSSLEHGHFRLPVALEVHVYHLTLLLRIQALG